MLPVRRRTEDSENPLLYRSAEAMGDVVRNHLFRAMEINQWVHCGQKYVLERKTVALDLWVGVDMLGMKTRTKRENKTNS